MKLTLVLSSSYCSNTNLGLVHLLPRPVPCFRLGPFDHGLAVPPVRKILHDPHGHQKVCRHEVHAAHEAEAEAALPLLQGLQLRRKKM